MLGNVGIIQLLIVLLIIGLIFGTKRLRQMGSDLGNAIKGFRNSMTENPAAAEKSVTGSVTENKDTSNQS